jgi:uncharacterized protein (DUF1810 family)
MPVRSFNNANAFLAGTLLGDRIRELLGNPQRPTRRMRTQQRVAQLDF